MMKSKRTLSRRALARWCGSSVLALTCLYAANAQARTLDRNGDGEDDVFIFTRSTGTFTVLQSDSTSPGVNCGQKGDVPLTTDLNGDGHAEVAVWRPDPHLLNDPNVRPSKFIICNGSTPTTVELGSIGDIPFAGEDFDGDGRSDLTVYRPLEGKWFIGLSTGGLDIRSWGKAGDVPVPGDYDGDGKADTAVFRPQGGMWFIRFSSTLEERAFQLGLQYDIPVPGDFDGDGKTDLAVFRPVTGRWFVRTWASQGAVTSSLLGLAGDVPLVADINGDGEDDFLVYRPKIGKVFVSTTRDGQFSELGSGPANAVLANSSRKKSRVPADFDGDGRSDYSVVRIAANSPQLTWYVADSDGQLIHQVPWGLEGDALLPGDYDGDGQLDFTVARTNTATTGVEWFVQPTNGQSAFTVAFGLAGDRVITGDFDGDGKTDQAVVRNEGGLLQWYARSSLSGSTITRQWGLNGDVVFAGDVNGDGVSDFTTVRNINGLLYWFSNVNGEQLAMVQWGLPIDTIVPGDYDGDGRMDYAVVRDINGQLVLFVRTQAGQIKQMNWGLTGDVFVPGNYSGRSEMEPGVWRTKFLTSPSFLLNREPMASTQFAFGLTGDTPVRDGISGTTKTVVVTPPPPTDPTDPPPPPPGDGLPCQNIREMAFPELYKRGSSSHIPGSDPRTGKPSYIGGQPSAVIPSYECVNVLDRNGTKVSSFGRYAVNGTYKFRYYVGHNASRCGGGHTYSQIDSAARRSGSPTIYLHKSPNQCVRITGGASVARQGSVR